MKEQKQKVSSPLFSALQDRYHILHLQPMVDIRSRAWRSSSIVGLIVEDLWSFYEIATSSCPPHWYGATDLERDSHLFAVHFPALTASVVRFTGAGGCLVVGTPTSLSANVDVALCFCYGGLLRLQLGFIGFCCHWFCQSMSSTLGTLLCLGAMVLVYFRALLLIIFLEQWGSPLRRKFCIILILVESSALFPVSAASSALLTDLFPVLLFSIDVLVFAGNTLLGLLFSSQCWCLCSCHSGFHHCPFLASFVCDQWRLTGTFLLHLIMASWSPH
uniref:Uncharacterized protein n=1 Tax=Quercus lobata TaxID=97700 RepID=A0A7N2LFK0_QUELO